MKEFYLIFEETSDSTQKKSDDFLIKKSLNFIHTFDWFASNLVFIDFREGILNRVCDFFNLVRGVVDGETARAGWKFYWPHSFRHLFDWLNFPFDSIRFDSKNKMKGSKNKKLINQLIYLHALRPDRFLRISLIWVHQSW